MAIGHANSKGDMNLLEQQYTKNKGAGEKAMGFEFKANVIGYPELSTLVRTAQIPAMGRSDVEDFGPSGLKFNQHGAWENSGESVLTFVETITGTAYKAMREIIIEKKYVDIELEHTPESNGGKTASGGALKFTLKDCKLRMDASDLSYEDTAALIKPSVTVVFNFIV